jgi:hypothetical protein
MSDIKKRIESEMTDVANNLLICTASIMQYLVKSKILDENADPRLVAFINKGKEFVETMEGMKEWCNEEKTGESESAGFPYKRNGLSERIQGGCNKQDKK